MVVLFWMSLGVLAFYIIDGHRKYNALEARLRDIQVSDQKRRTEMAARILTLENQVAYIKTKAKALALEAPKKNEHVEKVPSANGVQIIRKNKED